jgi:surfactin synthase thioesterase subunit
MAETPYTSLPDLIASLAEVLANQDATPFAFFGHSLGGLVAFELARFCALYALPMPSKLIVSGTDAPQHRSPPKNLHKMADDELIEALGKYNGTPPEILQHRELMELVLPTIRADFAMAENYAYRVGPLLHIPITVYAGKSDDHIMPQQVANWQKETSGQCSVHWFEGDHFFINSERSLLYECLRAELSQPQRVYPIRSQEITSKMVDELNAAAGAAPQECPEMLQQAG